MRQIQQNINICSNGSWKSVLFVLLFVSLFSQCLKYLVKKHPLELWEEALSCGADPAECHASDFLRPLFNLGKHLAPLEDEDFLLPGSSRCAPWNLRDVLMKWAKGHSHVDSWHTSRLQGLLQGRLARIPTRLLQSGVL